MVSPLRASISLACQKVSQNAIYHDQHENVAVVFREWSERIEPESVHLLKLKASKKELGERFFDEEGTVAVDKANATEWQRSG